MNHRRLLILLPFALLAASLAAQDKPNIVFVLTDQWRGQATGYAGDPNVKTPNLDVLASQSVNFENAVSVLPVCTPYRASLMTGRYPTSTGMFLNDLHLPAEEVTMAELFAEAGYDTGYIGKWHLDGHGRFSFTPPERRQGFDYWKAIEYTRRNMSFYYAGDDNTLRTWPFYPAYPQTKDAQAYIERHADSPRPFLLVVAYSGPQFPDHPAPDEYMPLYPASSIKMRPNVSDRFKRHARSQARAYYAHCSALDSCVADLQKTLEATGISENTIFVFTSDHGVMLGSQGQLPLQKQQPWDESIRVPFLIRYPAKTGTEGRTIRAPINTPDILPTLLSLSGLAIPDRIEGEDLSALVTGRQPDEDRAALFMSVAPFPGYKYGPGKEFRGIRTARYTYVRDLNGPWLMYDNETDPYQMENLLDRPGHDELQKELDGRLQAKLLKTGDAFLPAKDYLKAWGYPISRSQMPYTTNVTEVQSPADKP